MHVPVSTSTLYVASLANCSETGLMIDN